MKKVPRDRVKQSISVKCQCGQEIVFEPRWINKPAACAKCEAHFVPEIVLDPVTQKWIPTLRYTPVFSPRDRVRPFGASFSLANVICPCGQKITFDRAMHGRNMTCGSCGREFVVRVVSPEGGAAVVPEVPRRPNELMGPRRDHVPRTAPPPPPPPEMRVQCTCEEEIVVPSELYDRSMPCSACGALLGMQLRFDGKRATYELRVRLLRAPPP